jgi:hypothetical protein
MKLLNLLLTTTLLATPCSLVAAPRLYHFHQDGCDTITLDSDKGTEKFNPSGISSVKVRTNFFGTSLLEIYAGDRKVAKYAGSYDFLYAVIDSLCYTGDRQ